MGFLAFFLQANLPVISGDLIFTLDFSVIGLSSGKTEGLSAARLPLGKRSCPRSFQPWSI